MDLLFAQLLLDAMLTHAASMLPHLAFLYEVETLDQHHIFS